MNTLLTLKTAKLVREKGFDNESIEYSLITIWEVIMWLFKEHDIWISVAYSGKTYGFYPIIYKEPKVIDFKYDSKAQHGAPESSYEYAIEHVLTKLI